MSDILLEEALKAQKALRDAAGSGAETFPLPAFIGMISDEVEALRDMGKTDADIAAVIEANSIIRITAEDIRNHYATPEQRHGHHS